MSESNTESPALTISHGEFDAVIFDLDGVITKTARVHAAAWKTLFDEYLDGLSRKVNVPFEPFDSQEDYREYVDGKPRYEGVRSFLESRGIHLDWGDENDSPDKETVCGLGNRKNALFRERLDAASVQVFEPTVRLIDELRAKGFSTAVISSSKNCEAVLRAAGLEEKFDSRVGGQVASDLGLAGKPEPDAFLKAAKRIDAEPSRAIVVEDAISGVRAGQRGAFRLVIGIGEGDDRQPLLDNGADLVLPDLSVVAVG